MPSQPSPPAESQRVRGVEPDAVTRALIALYLEPHGYEVRLAPDVAEALRTLPDAGVRLFVCSEAGLRAAPEPQRERLREALGAVPVLALLEPGASPALTRGWPAVREWLSKPLRAEALLAVLQGGARRRVPAPALGPPAGGDGTGPLAGFEALIAEMEMQAPMVHELVASFLERAPAYLAEVAGGLEQGDLARADRAAHTMKGMCGNLRFRELVDFSERLRARARSGDAEAARTELASLRAALEAVQAALRARWSGLG
jgi:HPt (histidine-containing phosphotransfer) domain-containing protein